MTAKKRVETLRLLIGQNSVLSNSVKLVALYAELNRLLAIRTAKHDSRWLLSVLHTTRALDTSLSELRNAKGWGSGTSLNDHLTVFTKHQILYTAELTAYRNEIVYKRNKYMHEAGATPDQLEADRILREMEGCLSVVISRLT